MRYTYRYRSFFWPALLVLVGVVALLVNTGQIPIERIGQLIDLWPLILIVIGIELILRRTVHGVSGDIAAALIVLLAIVGAAAYITVAPNPSATHTLDASNDAATLTEATAEIDVGAATLDITSDPEVGADLYRAHIDYSGPKPDVRLEAGKLTISQRNNNFGFFTSRRFQMKLVLNPGVAWKLDVNTGSATTNINVAQAHVSSITLNTGAMRADLTVGPPSGSVPIQINGGALTVNIHRPSGTPASVSVSGGAVTLTVDGKVQHAVGSLRSEPADMGDSNYAVRVSGGACTVTLDTNAPSE